MQTNRIRRPSHNEVQLKWTISHLIQIRFLSIIAVDFLSDRKNYGKK